MGDLGIILLEVSLCMFLIGMVAVFDICLIVLDVLL